MKLNCKPMDLAVMVRSDADNEGKIVECIRLATTEEIKAINFASRHGPVWIISPGLISSHGRLVPMALDAYLHPIRDQPGEDETLTWAPVPHKETV